MMVLKPVRDQLDVEAMRRVRNACRAFMTRNVDEISFEAQQAWWAALNAGDPNFETWRPFLAWDGATVIGYGITWHGERVAKHEIPESVNGWWLTGGLLPQFRGKGYGRWLFERLIDIAGVPCWLEVRLDNARARLLYRSLGFVEVVSKNNVIVMKKESNYAHAA